MEVTTVTPKKNGMDEEEEAEERTFQACIAKREAEIHARVTRKNQMITDWMAKNVADENKRQAPI